MGDLGRNSRRALFSKNLHFIQNISIMVKISENLDLGQIFLKNLDWSQNFLNISILAKI